MIVLFFYALLLAGMIVAAFIGFRTIRNKPASQQVVEFVLMMIYILCILSFCIGWSFCKADYTEAIDPVNDNGYTPFAHKHSMWLIVFFLLGLASHVLIWLKGKSLPPLLFVSAMSMICIGVCISTAVFMQVKENDESGGSILLSLLPLYYIIISVLLIIRTIRQQAAASAQRVYTNPFLNKLNTLLATGYLQPLWTVLLMVPIFVLIMCILTLLGQDHNAFTKVFTDTTTWTFSQKEHPPYLDHNGHYLCTVAACGDPALVKPLHIGKRHGNAIIVNRQLQVANAFEELMAERFTSLHRVIRRLYDQYGYPLSKKITKQQYANLTYRLMKPLEYIFLFVLYCGCKDPEGKIRKQYR